LPSPTAQRTARPGHIWRQLLWDAARGGGSGRSRWRQREVGEEVGVQAQDACRAGADAAAKVQRPASPAASRQVSTAGAPPHLLRDWRLCIHLCSLLLNLLLHSHSLKGADMAGLEQGARVHGQA
jgi:hypothetical protein